MKCNLCQREIDTPLSKVTIYNREKEEVKMYDVCRSCLRDVNRFFVQRSLVREKNAKEE